MYGEISFDSSTWPRRGQHLTGRLYTEGPFSGEGVMTLTWTDAEDRVVYTGSWEYDAQAREVPFSMPTDRAETSFNRLHAGFMLKSGNYVEGNTDFFVVLPPDSLDDYRVVMYFPYKPRQQDGLRQLSINHGKIQPKDKWKPFAADSAKHWYEHGFRFYCDQTAVPLYANYHSPAYKPCDLMMLQAKELYQRDKTSKEAFIRHPSFHDEEAIKPLLDNLSESVRSQSHLKPLFYTTDETGVTGLIGAWDFDFHPRALADFREWLRGQYGSLDSLNVEWETHFTEWQDVEPFTTDEMIARGGKNFSPWADHRHFMNIVFARALHRMVETVHNADPDARAGIVGGQMPAAFGGYDYWLLSQVLEVIEPYNIGNNREMWRSFARNKPSFITAFGSGDMELWRHWFQALHGDRGVIIYDDKNRFLDEEGQVTEYGKDFVPLYKELTGGIVKQIAQEDHVRPPVAIHYSHSSVTAMWMLENPNRSKPWIETGSAGERLSSDFMRLRESCVKLAEDSFIPYEFIAYRQVEQGLLAEWMPKLLVLPQSVAMSGEEVLAVRRYVENGGVVLADAVPAVMDQHCKTLGKGQLDDLFGIVREGSVVCKSAKEGLTRVDGTLNGAAAMAESLPLFTLEDLKVVENAEALYHDADGRPAVIVNKTGKGLTIYLNADITNYHRWRLKPPEADQLREFFMQICGLAGVEAEFSVKREDGSCAQGLECHSYRFGSAHMYALNHNYQLRVSELGPPEYQDMSALTGDWEVEVSLPVSGAVYDVRGGSFLGEGNRVKAVVPSYSPLILSVLPKPVEGLSITLAPVERGGWLTADVRLSGLELGDAHVVNLWLEGPEGAFMPSLQQNLVLTDGSGSWSYPISYNQLKGPYTLCARDVLTGASARAAFVL